MKLFINMPLRMLGLLNPGNPSNDGFLESLKGPFLIVAVAIGLALIIAILIISEAEPCIGALIAALS